MLIIQLKLKNSDEYHWNLFTGGVQLTICQHWFMKWLGAEQATSNYLNQSWPSSLTHTCGTRGRWIKGISMSIAQRRTVLTQMVSYYSLPLSHPYCPCIVVPIWFTSWQSNYYQKSKRYLQANILVIIPSHEPFFYQNNKQSTWSMLCFTSLIHKFIESSRTLLRIFHAIGD